MGPIHSIYSVRDKCKVDAEVIDVRTTDGAKGPRYQLVGRHPHDGTTVTTFCSESVAEDFKTQLEILPHGLAAEGITILEDSAEQPAPDHLPESTAEVMSADGTPIEDDIEEYIEDPIIGSASEGTLTTVSEAEEVEVLAAEGPDPAAYDPLTESPVEESPLDEGPSPETFDSEFVQLYETTITKPEIMKKLKSAGIKPVDVSEIDDELFGIRIESSDVKSFQKEFNKKDWTGMFEFGAEGDSSREKCPQSGCDGELGQAYAVMCTKCDFSEPQSWINDAEEFGGFDVSLSNYTPIDSVTVEAPIGYGVTQNLGAEEMTDEEWEELVDQHRKQFGQTADLYCVGCEQLEGDCECPDGFVSMNEETEDHDAETFGVAGIDVQLPSQILVETPDSDQLMVPDPDLFPQGGGRVLGQQTGKVNATPLHAEGDEYDEYDDESRYERADVDRYEYERGKEAGDDAPTFFKNKKVLVPTAVIAGLGLAYLTKPELFKGAFGSIADALDRMKGDTSSDEDDS
jgi:hypothetical protein